MTEAIRPLARRLKSRATESEARLRGLDWAIPGYFLKDHKPRAAVAKPAFAGFTVFNSMVCCVVAGQRAVAVCCAVAVQRTGALQWRYVVVMVRW
ncbi:MAG: hypothetical protein NZM94_08815 [Roseiflexus sp.]|nr:hypothetical protein [Roseiflexus sp.]